MSQKFHINKHGVPAPCRARAGNCPLGGDDQHFDTKEDAQKFADEENERSHGLLPNSSPESRGSLNARASELYERRREAIANNNSKQVKELSRELAEMESQYKSAPKETWTETKSSAYNGSRIPLSKSNFIANGSGDYLSSKIEKAGVDSKTLVKALNEDDNIYNQWSVKSESENKITLQSKDVFGNEQFIDVSKESFEEEVKPKGVTSAYNSHRIPTALSNYVSGGGHEAGREYFRNVIDKSNSKSDLMVENLNNDKRIHGSWSVKNEDLKSVTLENTDAFGNVHYVEVSKGV